MNQQAAGSEVEAFDVGRRALLGRMPALVLAMATGFGARAAATESASATLMATGEPSRTARGAAIQRAVHQIVDDPRIFEDPYALAALGPLTPGELQSSIDRGSRSMRASIALRSRYTEDCLAAAVERGTRQYVSLGAGLDTFACRNPHVADGLQVYEVDHPATQALKRRRLREAGLALQPGTHFVPVDFETQTLRDALSASGFRFDRAAFFSMLGVSIYITDEAVMDTLRTVASCAAGSEISLSFAVPDDMLTASALASRRRSMAGLAQAGEPWITFYHPEVLARRMRDERFSAADVFGPGEANRRYFAGRRDGLAVAGAYMMLGRV